VHLLDPSAFTPPYDHALARALGRAGADVALYTSRFAYGSVPRPDGYERRESFYRAAARIASPRARRLAKLAEHVPDMLRYRRAARAAEIVHFQWLTVQHLDGMLLPARRAADGTRRPLVLTAHDVLPREPRAGQRRAQTRLYEHFDAVVVHSEHGARRLTGELGVDPARVHVIAHGTFEHLLAEGSPRALPSGYDTELPVVLCFGLMRPYKGIDLLLEAWRGVEGAELWIAGMPRMDIEPLRAAAPPGVRFLARFVEGEELAALFRRADLLVLPYREIDQSGVLFTGLAYEKAMLLSDVGGFPEIAATGAARTFAAGDVPSLRRTLRELLDDDDARERMIEHARRTAAGAHSWDAVARATLAMYERLLAETP
jgi:glycosyltransferase involved in cell wall biosynthesis